MIRKTTFTLIVGASFLLGGGTVAVVAADGANLAKEKCERCHGENGNSEKEIPSIAGFSTPYFEQTMKDYAEDERPGEKFTTEGHDETDMNTIAKSLNDDELTALGKFFAAQAFTPRQQDVDSELAEKGEKLYKKCKKCHTKFGNDPEDDAGILAGQWIPYLEDQIKQFLNKERKSHSKKMMKKLKKLKTEKDISAIAHFFGSQTGKE